MILLLAARSYIAGYLPDKKYNTLLMLNPMIDSYDFVPLNFRYTE